MSHGQNRVERSVDKGAHSKYAQAVICEETERPADNCVLVKNEVEGAAEGES